MNMTLAPGRGPDPSLNMTLGPGQGPALPLNMTLGSGRGPALSSNMTLGSGRGPLNTEGPHEENAETINAEDTEDTQQATATGPVVEDHHDKVAAEKNAEDKAKKTFWCTTDPRDSGTCGPKGRGLWTTGRLHEAKREGGSLWQEDDTKGKNKCERDLFAASSESHQGNLNTEAKQTNGEDRRQPDIMQKVGISIEAVRSCILQQRGGIFTGDNLVSVVEELFAEKLENFPGPVSAEGILDIQETIIQLASHVKTVFIDFDD